MSLRGPRSGERTTRESEDRSSHESHDGDLFGHLGRGHTKTVPVAEEKNMLAVTLSTLGGLNPLARAAAGPHGLEESKRASVSFRTVVLAHHLLDGFTGLISIVERDRADVVVEDVGLNDTVEELTSDETELAVDGGSGANGEVPYLRLIMRKSWVGVLQIGDGNEPVVDPEVRDTIPDEEVEPSIVLTNIVQAGGGEEETDITQYDQLGVLGLVYRAGWVEVVDTSEVTISLALSASLALTLVVVVASDVEEEIHWPSEELLQEKVPSGQERGLGQKLTNFMDGLSDAGCILLSGFGNEHHVTGKVAGGLVVLCVGDLPGEIRDHQGRVADPSNTVIEKLGGGESLVTTLMRHHPDTGAEHTLKHSIQGPQHHSQRQRRDGLRGHIGVEEVEGAYYTGKVARDIAQTSDGRTLEAVARNGITKLLDGIVWNLELVAVCVEHLGATGLIRPQRGQRSGRRRMTRTLRGRADSGRICRSVAVQRDALGECGGRHLQARHRKPARSDSSLRDEWMV